MTTTSPARYQIFYYLLKEFTELIKKLEADLIQRLNSINKGSNGGVGRFLPQRGSNTRPWGNLGLGRLGRWIWTGKAENFINNFNKMTLKEYVSHENEINLICEDIIERTFILNENYEAVEDIIEKFKKNVIEIVRKYAKQVEEEQAKEEKEISSLRSLLARKEGAPETMSDEEIERAHREREASSKDIEKDDEENNGPENDGSPNGELSTILTNIERIKEANLELHGSLVFEEIINHLEIYKKLDETEKKEMMDHFILAYQQGDDTEKRVSGLLIKIIQENFIDQVLTKFNPSVAKGHGSI